MGTGENQEEELFFTINGKESCDEDKILSILLKDGVLFSNEGEITGYDGGIKTHTVVLYVLCNDLFYWACADAEPIRYHEIGQLYKAWEANKNWGTDKWCCMKRNLQPQEPIVEAMKKDGFWDEELEALPIPAPS